MFKITKLALLLTILGSLSTGCIVVTDPVTDGELFVSWTLNGANPAAGACEEFGASTITVKLLDESQSTTVLEASTACADGALQLAAVPPGSYFIQIDAFTADGVPVWGNVQLAGPILITAGVVSETLAPIDLVDLRASVSLDWQFGNGKSCAAMGVSTVLVEIRDAENKRVVAMSANDAKKPCALSVNSSFAERVIDMQFENPLCSIPAGAKSFVLCGITGNKVGISVSAVVDADGKIYEGGSMQILDVPGGAHTVVTEPLYLDTCNTTTNICGAP